MRRLENVASVVLLFTADHKRALARRQMDFHKSGFVGILVHALPT
jgi:hypothetical protein